MYGSAAAGVKARSSWHGYWPVPWPEDYHYKQCYLIVSLRSLAGSLAAVTAG
jgi:hypothetical protein